MAETPDAITVEEHLFTDDGHVPNDPYLPLIVYRAVLETGPRAAAACEALFAGNDWSVTGAQPGSTGSTHTTTITAPRTRRSASPPDPFGSGSAVGAARW